MRVGSRIGGRVGDGLGLDDVLDVARVGRNLDPGNLHPWMPRWWTLDHWLALIINISPVKVRTLEGCGIVNCLHKQEELPGCRCWACQTSCSLAPWQALLGTQCTSGSCSSGLSSSLASGLSCFSCLSPEWVRDQETSCVPEQFLSAASGVQMAGSSLPSCC